MNVISPLEYSRIENSYGILFFSFYYFLWTCGEDIGFCNNAGEMHAFVHMCMQVKAYLTKFLCFSKYELMLKNVSPWVFTDKFCICFWCADLIGRGEEKYITKEEDIINNKIISAFINRKKKPRKNSWKDCLSLK